MGDEDPNKMKPILRDLRNVRKLTQADMARILAVGQDRVSKLENQRDCKISTLRRFVHAMGGRLYLVAEFPDGERRRIRVELWRDAK